MRIHRVRNYIFYGALFIQVFAPGVMAQTDSDSTVSRVNDAADSTGSIHSLYAGTGYGNNMLYLGTTMSQDHAFGYATVSYGLFDKLYFSATGYSVSGFSPVTAFYNLGLTFNHTFNSWFDISTSLSRYNVAASLRDTLFSNFTYADATLGFDWKILYSKITAGTLLAGGSQFYLQTRHSRYFETPSFARGKAFFSFDPYVNIIFGTMISIQTAGGATETTLSPGYNPWRKRGSGTGTSTRYSDTFGPMELDFGIPVAFNYDLLSLEIEPGYVIPLYSEIGSSGTSGFLLTASLFVRIF